MNSGNITKRATVTARSSSASASASAPSASSATGPATKTKKRVKRIRRKPKQKSKLKYLSSPAFISFAAIIVICITFLILSLRRARNNSTETDDHKSSHHGHKRNKYNNLDAENEPLEEKGFLDQMRENHGKYRHSDWMYKMGDHTVAYTNLRKEYDAKLPSNDVQRMRDFVSKLKKNEYVNIMEDDTSYDIHNCPENPPPNYPYAWNVQDVLENWPPDDTEVRTNIYQGLCVFDFETEEHKAMNYRKAEVPFVVQNDPKVLRTVERWAQPGYMEKLLGPKTKYRTEFSHDNHFMYWQRPGKRQIQHGDVPEGWKPPTEMKRMRFPAWLAHANVTDEKLLQPDHDHWYFRLIGCGGMGDCDRDSSEYLFDELSFFQPTSKNPLYMVEPKKQKGIHCRFGMKGVIAENHFDGSRNMIALLSGERRYILSHPSQCENLVLLPRGHPSARHSAVDWSDPDWEEFPAFKDAEVNEVVLQAGDVLYLPTNWFHYIISLELNYQCNTRSGVNKDYMREISECGF